MKLSNRAVFAAILTAAVAHISCGSDDPTRVGRPPVVDSYYPLERFLTAFVGDTLQFGLSASDPDHDPLRTTFDVDDHWAADGDVWGFSIEDTGVVSVRGQVTDGTHTSYIDWKVTRLIPVNLPPVIETTLPVEPNPTLVIGNTMNFAVIARDPEEVPLRYSFSVNDSLVASARQFTYLASSVGLKHVKALVKDAENTVSYEWVLKVTTIPDNIPPAQVQITLAETGAEPGEVNLEWIAVGRDGMIGKASLYQVRTSPVPFLSEADWDRGSDRPGVPPPADPGEIMRMVAGGLQPAKATYVAVRASDDFGNMSSIGPQFLVVTRGMRFGGRVIDTVTGAGIPDAVVTFAGQSETTAADGTYEFTEQGYGEAVISARDETGPEVGAYFDYDKSYSVEHLGVVNMYLIPNYPLQTTYYTDFLQFFREMTDLLGVPYSADQHRRDEPLALYIPEFATGGLDYAQTLREVAADFDAFLGRPAFRVMNAPLPAEHVEIEYDSGLERDRHTYIQWTSDYYPVVSLIELRTVYSASSEEGFRKVACHELSHALGLNHSLDPRHMMVGGQAPQVPTLTSDEIAVLRTFYQIPRGWNVRRYQRN